MAEIIQKGGRRIPRIDLTPMVDLGFLLITFFVFTAKLSEPLGLEVNMPAEGKGTVVAHHTAFTLLLGNHHKVVCLSGEKAMQEAWNEAEVTDFTPNGLRAALIRHRNEMNALIASGAKGTHTKDEPFVLIKAGDPSQYEDLINALDELQINSIKQYALMDITPEEERIVQQKT